MRMRILLPAFAMLFILGSSVEPRAATDDVSAGEKMQQEIEAQTEVLRRLQNQLAAVCVDSTGKLDIDLSIMDEESGSQSLSCAGEAKRLDEMGKQLESKAADWDLKYGNPDCTHCGSTQSEGEMVLAQLSQELEKEECKPSEKTDILSAKCAGEVSCSMLRSIAMPSALLANMILPETKKMAGGCLDMEKGTCLTKLAEGLAVNVVSTLKAIGNLAVLGWEKLNDWIWGNEDATSEKGLIATGLTDEQLDQAEADQPGFFKSLFDSVYKGIEDGIKNGFACEDWEGIPYNSACLKPMKSWDCSTCDQKISAICGVAGYIGAEVITAFFTGGATAVTKTVATTTLKAVAITAKMAGKGLSIASKATGVTKLVKPLAKPLVNLGTKTAKGVSYGSRVARLAFLKGTHAVTRSTVAKQLKLGLARVKTSMATGGKAMSSLNTTGLKTSLKVIGKVGKVLASPVTGYFRALKSAFLLGFRKTDEALARVGTKFHFYTQASTKAGAVTRAAEEMDVLKGCK